jgi:hypothetical protein
MTEAPPRAQAERLPLLVDHFAHLHEGSGIDPDVIGERAAFSATSAQTLERLGFSHTQAALYPGLVLPVWPPDGRPPSLHVLRPDHPREDDQGKRRKYEVPFGARLRLDCPPRCQPQIGDPAVPLWITEGQKKGDALATHGFCALALLGVGAWRGTNARGGKTALPDWSDVALNDRLVTVVFDSDVMRKAPVQRELAALTAYLEHKGARVRHVYLPEVLP